MNYQEVYQQRLGAMTESILGNKIKEEIEIKSIGDTKLTRLYEDMEQITGKTVYEDFNYRCGKVLGVLKHIAQNSKFSKQLYELTGLNRGYIDIYYSACGQLPYVNKGSNTVNIGRKMDIETTKELLMVTAATLGVILEEADLADINQQRWDKMYNDALEAATKTVELNDNALDAVYDE